MALADWSGVDEIYYNNVENAISSDLNINLPNSTLSHARYLIYNLIKRANNYVKIFSGRLDKNLYGDGDIQEVMREAINNNVKIDIIVEQNPETNLNTIDSRIRVSKINDATLSSKIPGHFLIVDGKAFRFEKEHGKILSHDEVGGVVNFNCPPVASSMEILFNHLGKSSNPISE